MITNSSYDSLYSFWLNVFNSFLLSKEWNICIIKVIFDDIGLSHDKFLYLNYFIPNVYINQKLIRVELIWSIYFKDRNGCFILLHPRRYFINLFENKTAYT